MPEYIVELLVVVDADTAAEAEKIGKQAQSRAWKSKRIKNVLLAEVRGEEEDGRDE